MYTVREGDKVSDGCIRKVVRSWHGALRHDFGIVLFNHDLHLSGADDLYAAKLIFGSILHSYGY